LKGKKEFEEYLTKLNLQKADIQGRIEKNKTWIVRSCKCTNSRKQDARQQRNKLSLTLSLEHTVALLGSHCMQHNQQQQCGSCAAAPAAACIALLLSPASTAEFQAARTAASGVQLSCCENWLQDNFEANSDNGAFEAQYKRLLEEIQQIYESAKEFHGKVCSWEEYQQQTYIACSCPPAGSK
jgi:hypothetical protein